MRENDLAITPAEVASASASTAKMLEEDGGGALASDLANACRMVNALALMVEKLAEARRSDLDDLIHRIEVLEMSAAARQADEGGGEVAP